MGREWLSAQLPFTFRFHNAPMRLFNQRPPPKKSTPAAARPQARTCRRDATCCWHEAWLSCPRCPPFLKVSSRLPSPLLTRHPPARDRAPSCSSSSLRLPLELPNPKHPMHRDQAPRRCLDHRHPRMFHKDRSAQCSHLYLFFFFFLQRCLQQENNMVKVHYFIQLKVKK